MCGKRMKDFMKKHWSEVGSIGEAVECFKHLIEDYREDLSKKEKENLASAILSLTFCDDFQAWSDKFPVLERIEAFASDLEWSNSLDVDEDWEKFKGYIDQLERELASR